MGKHKKKKPAKRNPEKNSVFQNALVSFIVGFALMIIEHLLFD